MSAQVEIEKEQATSDDRFAHAHTHARTRTHSHAHSHALARAPARSLKRAHARTATPIVPLIALYIVHSLYVAPVDHSATAAVVRTIGRQRHLPTQSFLPPCDEAKTVAGMRNVDTGS